VKKVLCKRTYINEDIKFIKGKYYSIKDPNEQEKLYIFYYIKSEKNEWYFIVYKEFIKYFTDIVDLRDNKINSIIN